MTDPEHDLSDEEVARRLAETEPVITAVRRRVRGRVGSREEREATLKVPYTPEGIAKMRRFLPGGANRGGRAPKTNAVDDAGGDRAIIRIVTELRRNQRRVSLASVAAASGTFTRDNLRYWLGRNDKHLSDY